MLLGQDRKYQQLNKPYAQHSNNVKYDHEAIPRHFYRQAQLRQKRCLLCTDENALRHKIQKVLDQKPFSVPLKPPTTSQTPYNKTPRKENKRNSKPNKIPQLPQMM